MAALLAPARVDGRRGAPRPPSALTVGVLRGLLSHTAAVTTAHQPVGVYQVTLCQCLGAWY